MQMISKYRSFIMGMAILWVAWFHTDMMTGNACVDFFRQIGYGGVDIFFFLSGVGAYFSLKKNTDVASFMKRRAIRILPSYYPFIVAWIIMMKLTGEMYGTEIIGNLTMLGWWHGGRSQFNWYVSAIWLFYLLAPVIVGTIENARNKFFTTVAIMTAALVASVAFFHTLLLTAFSRVPIFVLGIFTGYLLYQKLYENNLIFVLLNVLMLVGFAVLFFCFAYMSGSMWNYGLWWYPFIMITPGLVVDLGLLANLLEKNGLLSYAKKGVECLGDASFEIYLIHIGMFEYAKAHLQLDGLWWGVLFIATLITGVLYSRLINCIKKRRRE